MMRTVATTPFSDQKPGTSGLRKKVPHFSQPNYAENFLQAIFDAVERPSGSALVIGGDGRFFNADVVRIAIRMAVKHNGSVTVQAGCGIVADSVPEKEYEETENKAKAVMLAIENAEEVNDR